MYDVLLCSRLIGLVFVRLILYGFHSNCTAFERMMMTNYHHHHHHRRVSCIVWQSGSQRAREVGWLKINKILMTPPIVREHVCIVHVYDIYLMRVLYCWMWHWESRECLWMCEVGFCGERSALKLQRGSVRCVFRPFSLACLPLLPFWN